MRILVVTSPLVKIFQEKYHTELLRNPESVYSEEMEDGTKTQIVVPRPSGEIKFVIGTPQPIGGPRGSDKEQDTLYLAEWLSGGEDGGQNQETDSYGIADMGLDPNTANTLLEHLLTAAMAGSKPNLKSMGADIGKQVAAALERAKDISHRRTMRAVEEVNSRFEQNKVRLETDGKTYHPSTAEWLCRYVLRKDIEKREAERKRLMDLIDKPLTEDPLGVQPSGS